MHQLDETYILLFLVQVSVLLGLARLAGLVLRKWGQPAITGEILVGVLLGPTVLGRVAPGLQGRLFPADASQMLMLETVGWLGILLFLLDTGLQTDLRCAWRQRQDAIRISTVDLLLPMALAFAGAVLLPAHYHGEGSGRILFSLFLATILTISALPVTARILQELGVYRSDAGLLTMSALTINDLAGWVVFALILGFATSGGLSLMDIGTLCGSTLVFAVAMLTLGRRVADRMLARLDRLSPLPGTSLTLICLLGMLSGAITTRIGIHALFGFFVAGIVCGQSHHLSENTRGVISQTVHALLVPLFFASIGLHVDFLREFDVLLVGFMMIVGVTGRFLGAWAGVGLTRHPRGNRHLIAAAHTPGGEMQIVIGMLAIEYQVITPPVFVAIVISSVLSSVALGPWMKWALDHGRRAFSVAAVSRAQVVPVLLATTREEAIRTLAGLSARIGGLDEREVAEAVLARESLMGTALGEGFAVPHARLPHLATPRIVCGRSPTGIDWNSPDGAHVHLVVLILTPEGDDTAQLAILRTIAHIARNATLRTALLACSDEDLATRLADALRTDAAEACHRSRKD